MGQGTPKIFNRLEIGEGGLFNKTGGGGVWQIWMLPTKGGTTPHRTRRPCPTGQESVNGRTWEAVSDVRARFQGVT